MESNRGMGSPGWSQEWSGAIDSHVHWFDLENNEEWYPSWPPLEDAQLRKTFLPIHYFNQITGSETGSKIKAGIHVQVPHHFQENFWIKKLTHQNEDKSHAGMVGWVDLMQNETQLKNSIEQIKMAAGSRKIVSFRHVAEAEVNPDWLEQPEVIESVKIIGKMGFCFDLLVRTRNLKSAINLVQSCPDVKFIIDHMAKPEVAFEHWDQETKWITHMKTMAQMSNVFCKISGFYSESDETHFEPNKIRIFNFVSKCFEYFGPSRLIWGSDWPVSFGLNNKTVYQNFKIYFDAVQHCTTDIEQIENIFCNNAKVFYNL
jgi:L-fuconolactonase